MHFQIKENSENR